MHQPVTPSSVEARHSHGYVPAIDGLRFLAVGSVMLFHLHHGLLPGGFTGVDVFFVLSGYLITGQLTGPARPTLVQFYQNRIARIAPASLAVVAAVLVAAWFIFAGRHLAYVGTAAAAAATSLINLKLMGQQGYFTEVGPTLPLLHFWSLAVEEQFYLFYPAALLLLARFGVKRAIIVAGLASFALCVALTWLKPVWAFYLLPTRAWELCAGGWLALVHRDSPPNPARDQRLGWLGLALLALAFVAVDETRHFPGFQALLPVGATLLLLGAARGEGRLPRLLATRLPVWVGLRSYSLYLWHWPVYVFADYALYWMGWWQLAAVKAGLTLLLAMASYSWIERPLRSRLRQPARRRLAFAAFFAAVALLAAAGYTLRNFAYLSAEGPRLTQGGYLYNPGAKPRVALVGDSQAAMYGTPLRDAALAHGWHLRVLAAAGTSELPGEPATRWPEVRPWLAADRPDVVVIAEHWAGKPGEGAMLDQALTEITRLGSRAVVILQPPEPANVAGFSPWTSHGQPVTQGEPQARLAANAVVTRIAARHPGTRVIDPAPLFLDQQARIRVAAPSTRLWYDDGIHLSSLGAERVMPLVVGAVEQGK